MVTSKMILLVNNIISNRVQTIIFEIWEHVWKQPLETIKSPNWNLVSMN
jgi:uncharacterized membrane protein